MHKIDTLFLHMGPGLNAQIEAKLLSKTFPSVLFWDQPKQDQAIGAFSNIVNAAIAKVKKLAEASKSVRLFAHSFGGHLGVAILKKVPHLINSCVFISTGYSIAEGFYNLLKTMAQEEGTDPELAKTIRSSLSQWRRDCLSLGDVWKIIDLILKDPEFMRHYWAKKRNYVEYLSAASDLSLLHFPTFRFVLNDFLSQAPEKGPLDWKGEILISLGDRDCLIQTDLEIKNWKRIFPKAKTRVLSNCGHFIHFEANKTDYWL